MKRKEQEKINEKALYEFSLMLSDVQPNDYDKRNFHISNSVACNSEYVGQLRSCSAEVYESENYFILRSYNTIIACINKHNGNASDFLRHVYGYTSTSAQHISKFFYDYGAKNIYRFYSI